MYDTKSYCFNNSDFNEKVDLVRVLCIICQFFIIQFVIHSVNTIPNKKVNRRNYTERLSNCNCKKHLHAPAILPIDKTAVSKI